MKAVRRSPPFAFRIWLIAYSVLLSLVLAPPVHSATRYRPSASGNQQSTIVVDSSSVVHTFGGQMTFAIAAHSDAGITEAALLLRVGADSRTDVTEAEFTPGLRIDTRVTRDLQAQPIPPFATVVYSWRLTDSAGQTLTTPEQAYLYEDNRFSWQSVVRGPVHAHWHSGDFAFGQSIADIGYQALDRASRLMDAAQPETVDIYVYEKLGDLQSGLSLGGRTWVAGHADPSLGVVLVYSSPDPIGLLELENTLSHELTHVMVYQIVGPGYSRMPVWLDEGLATNSELRPSPTYADALTQATKAEALLPLESLCGSFGVDGSRIILSYAQSASVVRYIRDRWGPSAIGGLLAAYRDGASCQGGVQRVLNVSLAELQADWVSDVLRASPFINFLRSLLPYLLVFGPVAIILAALLFVPKRK
jgi:hypothetical protein